MNLKRLSPVVMSHVIAAVTFGPNFFLEVYKIHFYLLSIKAQHPNNMLNQFAFISLFLASSNIIVPTLLKYQRKREGLFPMPNKRILLT